LYDIQVPEGLLAHGIRQYFVDSCKGRQIVGSVMRAVDPDLGRLIISITAAPSVSDDFGEMYWTQDTGICDEKC